MNPILLERPVGGRKLTPEAAEPEFESDPAGALGMQVDLDLDSTCVTLDPGA